MRFRLVFALVTLLFISMNVWLWRMEYGGRSRFHSPVPVETVWHKVTLAQDPSHLILLHEGRRIGFCRWSPTVLQQRPRLSQFDDLSPEEMTQQVTGYSVDLDGHFLVDATARLRFNANLRLDTNFVWRSFDVRFLLRPDSWEVSADAARQTLHVRIDDEDGRRERTFKFTDLEQPEQVARRLGLGGLAPLLAGIALPLGRLDTTNLLSGVTWSARRDRLPTHGAHLPVYRVQASVLDRPQVTVFVSMFGEILRVELPGQVALVPDVTNAL